MPTPTYIPLATVTLGSSASSVTFSSIPATFRDLVLVHTLTVNVNTFITFNGDTGSNYNRVFMLWNGTTLGSEARSNETSFALGGARQNNFQIIDYSATDKHKTALQRYTQGNFQVEADAYRWANTAAITSMTISGSFSTGSIFSIYGIAS